MIPSLLVMAAVTAPAQPPGLPPPKALADCLRACPPYDRPGPFLRWPQVDVIEKCRESGAADGCEPKAMWTHTFHKAARFTPPKFALNGEPVEAEALVIYEGMKLTVNSATGVYDLEFTATAPPTSVTLRLQLEFCHPSGGEPIRLTLPPIQLEPEEETQATRGELLGPTVRVSHRGYSELLTGQQSHSSDLRAKGRELRFDPLAGPFQITDKWRITRAGSARFGSARPNSDDPTR